MRPVVYTGIDQIYPRLLPADIGGVRGKGLLMKLSRSLLKPPTDLVHFFSIAYQVPWEHDYVIWESLAAVRRSWNKGITAGRLSFYNPKDVVIFRVNLSPDPRLGQLNTLLRRQVASEITKVGRASYDYMLYFYLVMGWLRLLLQGKRPPYDPGQLPYGRNRAFICTEAANYGWAQRGHPIIPPGVVPVPAGFIKALNAGLLRQIYPSVSKTGERR
jgi:hypothetical protein